MLRNYLTIAYRNFRRRPGYTFINSFGLAVGLACCILIAMYVRDEMSYDDFHPHADRIMLISTTHGDYPSPNTPFPLAVALEREAPGVAATARTARTLWTTSETISRDGNQFFEEEDVFHAGPSFFEMFNLPFVQGTPQHALLEPNTAVISTELAAKYFPEENPIGQTLHIETPRRGEESGYRYRIIGVARSSENSYLDFDAVLSLSTLGYTVSEDTWRDFGFQTFALLEEGATEETLDEQARQLAVRQFGEETPTTFSALPLTELYFSDFVSPEGFKGKWRYIYLFGAVAIFILLIACVNYVNLATARAAQRAREVGVRKTVGASRGQVARQFLGESVLLSGGAFLLAMLLAWFALPGFNHLFDMEMTFSEAGADWFLLLTAVTLGIGLLAGCYPAFYLSSFEPTKVLKGHCGGGGSGAWLRRGLVVVQFTIAVALLAGTAIIYQQLRFIQQNDLGFSGEQVILVDAPSEGNDAFKRAVAAHPGIVSATVTGTVPGHMSAGVNLHPYQVTTETHADTSQTLRFSIAVVDYDYLETLEIDLVAGRTFSRTRPADEQRAYLINETAARQLGWTPEEAVGKPFKPNADEESSFGAVIGVVEDFHTESLHEAIQPVVLSLHAFPWLGAPNRLAARLAPDAIQAGLRHIEEVRARFTDEPFEYTLLDEEFAAMYREERRLGQVFGGFAAIAILLACLGLFGLAAYAAERRTKEIGIRKVLGAPISSIVALLSKDFLKLVLIAFVIAAPVAYFAMQKWLQEFAYHIELGVGVFMFAGGLAVAIALATVSYQAIRAALADPVNALRSE